MAGGGAFNEDPRREIYSRVVTPGQIVLITGGPLILALTGRMMNRVPARIHLQSRGPPVRLDDT